jgi:hypothetical protein
MLKISYGSDPVTSASLSDQLSDRVAAVASLQPFDSLTFQLKSRNPKYPWDSYLRYGLFYCSLPLLV